MSEKDFSEELLRRNPVWKWDDDMEGHVPVIDYDPLPEDEVTLFIRATFTTPTGETLPGYLVGSESFYAIGLFVGGHEFVLNLNLPEMIAQDAERILELLGGSREGLFPLAYRDDVGFRHSPAIRGSFSP